ncbi:glutamate-1-semialdehyde 2,1-aminomutase [Verrucomicrobia bacterium]|nr:glutamate-1-semialdehyde 2,1-aminomutase [Verrucomicrobiales bacterium]MDC0049449.1 glutamate-1-semialdehyde 2,1-aminomutase [Verrucomicrobiota bacterium]|tara:strand:+ start:98 stop:1381 length:1284 start_codon:yes stop_codon:yes gene_type:complete
MPENFLSSKLFENANRLIPGGVNSPVRAFRNVDGDPFFVRAAKGSRLWDVDDNELIDYVGTWGPAILGHAPVPVIEAVHEAAKRGVSFGTPNPFEIEMAKIIVDWVPSVEKVRMVNSGTEATMSSIRLARGFTGRDKIIKFEGCYHGHVDSLLVAAGSGALTHGEPDSAGIPKAFASETIALPFNDPEKVQQIFSAQGSQIAAVILEPIPANAGLFFPEEGFLEFLREVTKEHGALLIFDEVMTGFRVAKGGAQELYGVMPDLTAMGKVIGGGLPVGAFGGRAEIMDQLAPDGPVYQAGTLSGNPLAMAAGLAQLKELDKLQGWQRLEETGALFEKGIREALSKLGKEYIFHRIGSMFCLFFTNSPVNDLSSATAAAESGSFKNFFHYCLNNGVFLAPSPYETGFISMAHSEEDILKTVKVIENAFI